jgi:hypothetical protein
VQAGRTPISDNGELLSQTFEKSLLKQFPGMQMIWARGFSVSDLVDKRVTDTQGRSLSIAFAWLAPKSNSPTI